MIEDYVRNVFPKEESKTKRTILALPRTIRYVGLGAVLKFYDFMDNMEHTSRWQRDMKEQEQKLEEAKRRGSKTREERARKNLETLKEITGPKQPYHLHR